MREPYVLVRVFLLLLSAVIVALAVAAMVVVTRGLAQSYQDTLSVFVGSAVLFLTESGIADCYRMLVSPTNATELQAAAADLSNMELALTFGLSVLQFGNATAGLTSPVTSDNIIIAFAALAAPVNETLAAIDVIQTGILVQNATAETPAVAAAIGTILGLQAALILPVEAILVSGTLVALEFVTSVQTQQYVFMAVILGALVLLLALVYVPLDRRIRRMSSILVDKNAELRRLNDDLTMVMQLSPSGIFRADPSGHVVYANERWHEITGLPPHARDRWLELVHPDDRAAVERSWQSALHDPVAQTALEFRLLRDAVSGGGASADASGRADSSGSGDRSGGGGGGAIDDVQWVLLQSRAEVAPCGDVGRSIGGARTSGVARVEHVENVEHAPDAQVGVVVGVVGTLTGVVVHSVVASLVNVTDRHRLEQERVELIQRAAAAADEHRHEQEIFVDTICHGIRNPLNGILNNVDLLRVNLEKRATTGDTAALVADDRTSLEAVETCANYQQVITDDVLNFSRLKANKVALRPSAFRLGSLLRTAMIMYAAEARAEDIDMATDVDDSVAALVVRHDRERLLQVLANLVSNAIKFTRSAALRQIRLRADVSPPAPHAPGTTVQVAIAVRDTGIGIASEDLPLLFHRFGRVGEGASRTFVGGSGLGLSICKLLVDLMGGAISVQSEPGHGAEFRVVIPCEVADAVADADAPAAAAAGPAPTAPATGAATRAVDAVPAAPGRVRVLIVEDNLINQSVLRRQLELSSKETQLAYEVTVADNGQIAVDLCEQQGFDVILMDIQMPVLDGIQATRALRARGHRMPIIGLSGNARQEQIDTAIAAGMQGYLVKPYNRKELVALINQLR